MFMGSRVCGVIHGPRSVTSCVQARLPPISAKDCDFYPSLGHSNYMGNLASLRGGKVHRPGKNN